MFYSILATTTAFTMTSILPSMNEKIKSIHALSPVVYMTHMKNPYKTIVQNRQYIENLWNFFNVQEIAPHNDIIFSIIRKICKPDSIFIAFCEQIIFTFAGHSEHMDRSVISAFFESFPDGCSTGQVYHYAQIWKSGKFRQYDFGTAKNLRKYHNAVPPEYNLTNVVSPVYLYTGGRDVLSVDKVIF